MGAQTRWLTPLEERAWRGHLRMSWLLDAAVARDLARDSGLSHADYYVLVSLSEARQRRLRMADLAEGIAWSRSRVSHQIARMEARGLVRREECSSDARGTYACLTPAGLRAIRAAAPQHVASIRRHLVDHLSQIQLRVLAAVAEQIVARLQADAGGIDE